MKSTENVELFLATLNSQGQSYGVGLTPAVLAGLTDYFKLLNEWNSRLHLMAPCSPAEFATRHVLESLFLLNYLPHRSTVIDVGSGGGLPLIPCLIARPSLRAILIDSSKKKIVFLRKVLKRANIEESAIVFADRFENLSGLTAEFVTSRALDRMVNKLPNLIEWAPAPTTLLLYGGNTLREKLQQLGRSFEAQLLPNSTQRFLFTVSKQ